jgi:GxxExxY protein
MSTRDAQTYAIIGAAMEVHSELGHGFLEPVYHDAICHELELRGIPYRHEVVFPIFYKGVRMKSTYRADLVCFEGVVVEIKAIASISGNEEAQLFNYLKASHIQRGLLLNFGGPKLQYERRVWNLLE